MSRSKLTLNQILVYGLNPPSQNTVRRAYLKWRAIEGLAVRCDNPNCVLHMLDQTWDNKPISMILDHVDGNRKNNRADNLRLLCPNCDSQLPTRGGKNKGRIRNATVDSYHVVERNGQLEVKVMLRGQSMPVTVGRLVAHVELESSDNSLQTKDPELGDAVG